MIQSEAISGNIHWKHQELDAHAGVNILHGLIRPLNKSSVSSDYCLDVYLNYNNDIKL